MSSLALTPHPPGLDLRSDFPILGRRIGGRRIVYLDSAATAQKPTVVLDAMDHFYRHSNANAHRGVYTLAEEATDALEGARAQIAGLVGGHPDTTVFTRNGTEALNLVAAGWATPRLGPGDAVLITEMEHHSNLVPWQMACRRSGASLRYLEVDDHGLLSLEQLDRELARGDVRVLAFAHISNVLGTINPVAQMTARARAAGAVTVVDGCQAVPQLPVDLAALGADFYAWTGHKALGPTGIGVLHGLPERLEEMEPQLGGGHMISQVQRDSSTWADVPARFEAGTANMAEAVGLGAAVDYLKELGMDRVREHEQALTTRALDGLGRVAGLHVVGPPTAHQRGGVIGFAMVGIHPHDVADLLNRDNVCVRAGHHCAQPLMDRLGVSATARASFGPYNVAEDVDALVESLSRAREVFGI